VYSSLEAVRLLDNYYLYEAIKIWSLVGLLFKYFMCGFVLKCVINKATSEMGAKTKGSYAVT
jgi:hypothetical protein